MLRTLCDCSGRALAAGIIGARAPVYEPPASGFVCAAKCIDQCILNAVARAAARLRVVEGIMMVQWNLLFIVAVET